jgi:ABC-type uncharacterized transport system ATPase subunit
MLDRGKKILDGSVSQIKKQHGSDRFSIRLDGDASFIEELSIIDSFSLKEKEICLVSLKTGTDANDLFSVIASESKKQNKTIESITRNEPSLHDIFVKIAGKSIDESGDVKNEK